MQQGREGQGAPASPPRTRIGTPTAQAAATTQAAYAHEWAAFQGWCRRRGHPALPAADAALAAYLLEGAPGCRPGTVGRRRAAIGAAHRAAGLPPPSMDAPARRLLRAAWSTTPRHARRPGPAALRALAAACPRDHAGLRDRALLLLLAAALPAGQRGAGATRAGLLRLDRDGVRPAPGGLSLILPGEDGAASATLSLARQPPAAPLCPVQALEDWLAAAGTAFGPVFPKVDRWGNVEHAALGADAWRRILLRRGRRA